MTKRRSEIRSVDRSVAGRFGRVEVFTSGTVELDSFLVREVGESEREESLTVAEDSGASAKITFLVLVNL